MFMLALADTGKYITEGCLLMCVSTSLCWHWQIQVNTLLKDALVCFYISVLVLADTGKYITEECLSVFLHASVGIGKYR